MKELALKLALTLSALLIAGFGLFPTSPDLSELKTDMSIELPDNIKEIVEAKCMGCHKPDSRNEKAKKKLQWVKVPDMDEEEQEHFIDEMFEVLEDGDMPPKKALERRPEMKLTDEEVQAFMTWLEAEEKKLKGE